MLNTRDFANGCRGKVPYESRGSAKTTARLIGKHSGATKNLRPYHCNACGSWHLTSMTSTQFRGVRRGIAERIPELFGDASPVAVAASEYDH